MTSEPSSFTGPLFVVGMPRSGTKLLRGVLNSHSNIGIPLNETEFLPYLERHWAQFGDLKQRERFWAFYRWTLSTLYMQNRQREYGAQIDHVVWYLACAGDFSLANVFEQLIRHDARVANDGIWGDKSPSYVRHLPVLKRLYPDAKFVHIIRDVRDYVLSMEKAFAKDRRRAAQRWVTSIRQAQKEASGFSDDVLMVRYEELLSSPSEVLKRVCAFLNVAYEEAMLTLQQATENLGDAQGKKYIVSGNQGKYLTKMNEEERAEIEAIAGELLVSLGYPCDYSGSSVRLSNTEMRRLQFKDAVNLIRIDSQRNGWHHTIRSRVGNFIKLRL